MTKLEEVARAMLNAADPDWVFDSETLARAAIQALRTPTEAMHQAMHAEAGDGAICAMPLKFTAAIDAILKESP